jgi:hypothetical protein
MSSPSPLPKTQPTQVPTATTPKYGFNRKSELLNGRAAMIGLLALLALEYLSGQGLLAWLGWR